MGVRCFFTSILLTLFFAVTAAADVNTSARMQLLFLGADPTEGAPGPIPVDMPVISLDGLPSAEEASQQVFAAILRSNPVSTFVTSPSANDGQFEQFFLVTDIGLGRQEAGLSIKLGSEQLTTEAFSARLGALVDAFNPEHRRLAFLRVSDPEDVFPVSMDELQKALGVVGFDVTVVMIENNADAGACTQDASRGVHFPLVTGVADRAPFGDGDGISSVSEVDDFLRAALHRVTIRDGACGPKYSLILKSGEDDSQPLLNHDGLPRFTRLETQLYHETFEALFLMESKDQAQLKAFLDECVYCPNEEALNQRLDTMRQYELASQLEAEIWGQISLDSTPVRLEIYLQNCTLCAYKADAEEKIAQMNAKTAAHAQEAETFGIASAKRDLVALRDYVETCVACANTDEAKALIASIEEDAVYQEEKATFRLAKESRGLAPLEAYLSNCKICSDQQEAEALLQVEKERIAVSAPCVRAAGLPQSGGPRKLDDIDQTLARKLCDTALDRFPEDPFLRTLKGRVDHAAGAYEAARAAYDYGVEHGVPSAYGLAAYTRYAEEGTASIDLAAAERLARKGAEHGDWLSQELLTVLYSKDLVPGKSASDAFNIAKDLARQGNGLAQFFVGYFYLTGSGVTVSEEAAFEWLTQSVDQGYLHAYSYLADLHEAGNGTDLAPDRAADLYWSAFRNGDATAKDRLTVQLAQRHRDVVRFVQEQLKTEGTYRGQIDGIAGPSTVAAVERFAETLTEPS